MSFYIEINPTRGILLIMGYAACMVVYELLLYWLRVVKKDLRRNSI